MVGVAFYPPPLENRWKSCPKNSARTTSQPSLSSNINCTNVPVAEYGCEPIEGKVRGGSGSQIYLDSRAARNRTGCYTDDVMAGYGAEESWRIKAVTDVSTRWKMAHISAVRCI
jgi:hypothetical protein